MPESQSTDTTTDDHPADFAAFATALVTGKADNPETQPQKPPEPKVEPKIEPGTESPKRDRIPSELIAKPETKVEPKAPESEIEKIKAPDFKDSKRKAQWDELHGKASEFEKRALEEGAKRAALETKLAELEAKGKDTEATLAKLAALEKERDEYRETVKKVNVELDPEFRRTHIEGRQKLITRAQQIVEEGGGDPKEIETALNLNGKARIEAIAAAVENIPQFQQGRLGDVINKLSDLDEQAAAIRSSPDGFLKEREEAEVQRKHTERTQREAAIRSAFEEARREAASELKILNRLDDPKYADWNARIDKVNAETEQFLTKNTDYTLAAKIAIAGHIAPHLEKMLLSEQEYSSGLEKKIAEQMAELKKLYGAGPNLSGRGGNGTVALKDMTMAERASYEMNGGGQS